MNNVSCTPHTQYNNETAANGHYKSQQLYQNASKTNRIQTIKHEWNTVSVNTIITQSHNLPCGDEALSTSVLALKLMHKTHTENNKIKQEVHIM